jgi:hypothetical protein
MRECFPNSKATPNFSPSVNPITPSHMRLLWCLGHKSVLCPHARKPSYCLCFQSASTTWEELSNSWSWVSSGCSCLENLEALPNGNPLQQLHRS